MTFDVTNTGKVKGDDVAQLYLSPAEEGQQIRPIKLQGFARVPLEPGETKKACIMLYPDQFGYFTHDGQRQWNIDPGKYTVKIGSSSQDIRLLDEIILKGEKATKPIRDYYLSSTTID